LKEILEELELITEEAMSINATFTCMKRLESLILEAETCQIPPEDLHKSERALHHLQEEMGKVILL